jgi:hypothetical protein
MADNELIIRINGNAKGLQKALDDARQQTEELDNALTSLAKISGAAFAAVVLEAGFALKAFGEAERASNELSLALQNQGLSSRTLAEDYKRQAAALQSLTGIDDDAIVAGQAVLQGMIGQTKISQDLTKAVLDLSAAKKIDLTSAFELVGKAINGNISALQRQGIAIDEGLTKEQRLIQVVERVSVAFGDQATVANQGVGSINGLMTAVGNLQEEIGSRLAPAFAKVVGFLTKFVDGIRDSKPLVDLVTSVGLAVGVVSALTLALTGGAIALTQIRAAMIAMKIATEGTAIAVKGLVGATGIGLLVIIASEIYLNWSSIFPKVQAIFKGFADNVGGIAGGLGTLFSGLVTFDRKAVESGLAQLKAALSKGYQEIKSGLTSVTYAEEFGPFKESDGEKKKREAADRAESERRAREARELAARRAHAEVLRLEADGESKQLIAIKKQEAEVLDQIADDKNAKIRDKLYAHYEELKLIEAEAHALSQEQRQIFQEEILQGNDEFEALSQEQKAAFLAQHEQELQSQLQSEASTKQLAAQQRLQAQINEHNTFLENQRKFGRAYAEIYRIMHSEVLQGSASAFSELTQLSTSTNSTLKSIGKVAGVADITIKTAQSAMNIYRGFSEIPLIGHALGIAGAAAAIAFGAEQTGRVLAAADGGLITGGIPGVDSVPVLAQQGELVVPSQNFEEVINSVRAQREASRVAGGDDGGGGQSGSSFLEIGFRENLMDFIETNLVARGRLQISVQGA